MNGGSYFLTMDLFSGYLQIPAVEQFKEKATFKCKFLYLSIWGHAISVNARLSKALKDDERVLEDIAFARVYLDNIVIFWKRWADHKEQVITIVQRLSNAVLWIHLRQPKVAYYKILLLGHIVAKEGISLNFDKIRAVADVPPPQ